MIEKLKKSKGFTLIEMLVVIAIIAVLVSIIVPVVGNSTAKAKYATDAANLRSMAATVAIDLLEDDVVTATPNTKSKSYGTVPVFYNENGNIVGYYPTEETTSPKYVSVDGFATAASTGNTPAPTTTPASGMVSPSP